MPASTTGTYAELHTPTSRLIRCIDAPPIDTLQPGDMVICERSWDSQDYQETCAQRGIHVRTGAHRYEDERVTVRRTRRGVLADYPEALLGKLQAPVPGESFAEPVVTASTNAFAQTWDALTADLVDDPVYAAAVDHVPEDITKFLPYPTLNPAQVEAAALAVSDESMVVVAPTGAGKTVIGEIAVLKEILHRRGKAVWLVPQRSLTNELDRGLDAWRAKGLNIVALSGESSVDQQRTRDADLWVATTEKFEALCRGTSMRETIGRIGTIVVDEIHLLGDPSRGPVLETLLARITRGTTPVRLVGLSATAANAGDIATWLDAQLLEITWRPTRTTQQLLTIPDGPKTQTGLYRNKLCAAITREVSADGGSTLVFCGTKAAVRSTALALAASRGADTSAVNTEDAQAVHQVCLGAGVGLHYSDWPHKRDAERAFLDRRINVLVATSTLAAGVNTPARAVVVRDTTIGMQDMEISMIQQMFGRAGRAGKEPEGWAYVIVETSDHAVMRKRLAAGYTITSGILESIPDHLLGEVVQGHVTSAEAAEHWWASTLAYHQGSRDLGPLREAVKMLTTSKMLTESEQGWEVTALGRLTSKMMVEVADTAGLLVALGKTRAPRDPDQAEERLIELLATTVTTFAGTAGANRDQARAVTRILEGRGRPAGSSRGRGNNDSPSSVSGADVVRAGLLALIRSPQAFTARSGKVLGVNRSSFNSAIYDSPRYFAWLSAIGPLGVAPAWASVVASDLAQRVTHYRLLPPRGAGRLLRAAARLCGGPDSPQMQSMWDRVVHSGIIHPAAMREPRVGAVVMLSSAGDGQQVSPSTAVAFTAREEGARTWVQAPSEADAGRLAVLAAFDPHGDWEADGWLSAFCTLRT